MVDELYPIDCPFCKIADSYPTANHSLRLSSGDDLKSCVPEEVDAQKVDPNCHLVLSAPTVLAFLDIMPMTRGHLLVTSRSHHVKIGEVPGQEAADIGRLL